MRRLADAPLDLIEHEFAQEKASTLGRLGRAFECALKQLKEFDADQGPAVSQEARRVRSALIEQTSTALWYFVVQREACGLHDVRHVLRDYAVPPAVATRMGGSDIRNTASGIS